MPDDLTKEQPINQPAILARENKSNICILWQWRIRNLKVFLRRTISISTPHIGIAFYQSPLGNEIKSIFRLLVLFWAAQRKVIRSSWKKWCREFPMANRWLWRYSLLSIVGALFIQLKWNYTSCCDINFGRVELYVN